MSYINMRIAAKTSPDPDAVAWYIGLAGNPVTQEQFAIAKGRVEALVMSGWTNRGNYSDLASFLVSRAELADRIDDDPTRFTSVPFMVEGARRYFLLEAPRFG